MHLSYYAEKNPTKLIKVLIKDDILRFNVVKNILKDNDVDMVWCVFRSPDEAQHYLYYDEGITYLEIIYEEIDHPLNQIMNELDDIMFIVISDHGFSQFKKYIHVNNILEKMRLLRRKNSKSIFNNVKMLKLLKYLPLFVRKIITDKYINNYGSLQKIDLKNSKAYCPSYTSQSIIVIDGKIDTAYPIINALLEIKDDETNKKVIKNVYLMRDSNVYEDKSQEYLKLIITTEKGYMITSNFSYDDRNIRKPISLLQEKKGDHDMDGIFGFWAKNGLNKKGNLGRKNICDITPTIYSYLNIKTIKDVDGVSIL